MAKSKFLAWQLWGHYVLLEALVVLFLHLSEQHWIHENPINLIWLYLILALGDQAIHLALAKTTGWKD